MRNTSILPVISNSLSSKRADVLSRIVEPDVNLCNWQRDLDKSVTDYVNTLLDKPLNLARCVTPQDVQQELLCALPEGESQMALISDVSLLVDMLCCLFGIKQVGLRLRVLDSAMCPRFHTDKLVCRLVSSYSHIGTQWLANHALDRTRLGHGSGGRCDAESGLYQDSDAIVTATPGDVLLLKGESWPGNEGLGVVHRSPALSEGQKRLVLTLDPM